MLLEGWIQGRLQIFFRSQDYQILMLLKPGFHLLNGLPTAATLQVCQVFPSQIVQFTVSFAPLGDSTLVFVITVMANSANRKTTRKHSANRKATNTF